MKKIFAFLRKHKNRVILCSMILLFVLFVLYFASGDDSVALKGLVLLLCILAYLGIFFGIRLIGFIQKKIQNKLLPLPEKAQKILAAVIMIFAFIQAIVQTFNFIFTSQSFYLILCSCFTALFCSFVCLA